MKTIKNVINTILALLFSASQAQDFTHDPMTNAKHMNTLRYQEKTDNFSSWMYRYNPH